MPKYKYSVTRQFRRDVKLCIKKGLPMDELEEVMNILLEEGQLPKRYHPHRLSGNLNGIWECHVRADWLLLWIQNDDELIMLMTRTGTHSDVFG